MEHTNRLARVSRGRKLWALTGMAVVALSIAGVALAAGHSLGDWNSHKRFHASSPQQLRRIIARHYRDLRASGAGRDAQHGKDMGSDPTELSPTVTQGPDSAWPAGIRAEPDNVLPEYSFLNLWEDSSPSVNLAVYAGSESADMTQGIVYIQQEDRVTYQLNSDVYLTPEPDGPVTVTAADGHVLTLSAEDGTTFTFDVDSRTWSVPSPSPSSSSGG